MSASAALNAIYRTCPVTKLKINRDAETLIKVNAVVAILFFMVGVVAAALLILTRWQTVHLLPAEWYYRIVTAHGLSMLIFFIIFFEMALLYFVGPVVLGARIPTPWVAWIAFAMMLVGAVMVEIMVWSGNADVMFTSYVPLKAHPLYYLGIIIFAVGALVAALLWLATIVVAKLENTYEGSMPLVTFGGVTAVIITVVTLLHGALIMIPTFLWSMGVLPVDAEWYRLFFWGFGHASQQINVALMVSVWYLMGGLTIGAVVLNEKISRAAFVLYILFINLASAHHLLVDPGFSPSWKVFNTSYAFYMAVLASMIHGFTVPGGMEMGQRLRGYTNGTFEWLRKAPWGDPGFSGTFLSLIIFGFLGGITGVTIGTEQISIIGHNTLRIPGHFHATVVGGTALAFMAVTYYLIPLIFRKQLSFFGLAKIQPFLFGGGITILAVSFIYAGIFGAPRRHWDITFAQAPFKVEYHPAVDMLMGFAAIGGLLAVTGAVIFILVTVVSVFFGKPLTEADLKSGNAAVPQGVLNLPPQEHDPVTSEAAHRNGTPGTVILAGIFLLVFATYYFVNWQILSMSWIIG